MARTKIIKSISFPSEPEKEIMDFINLQSNLSDTVYYLLQKEIAENGIRNLQQWIPQERTVDSVRTFIAQNNPSSASPSAEPVDIPMAKVNSTVPDAEPIPVDPAPAAAVLEHPGNEPVPANSKEFVEQSSNEPDPADSHTVDVITNDPEESVPAQPAETSVKKKTSVDPSLLDLYRNN